MNKKAIILLSGGIDSATCLALAKSQQYDCYALSYHYGQKHNVELEAARKIAKFFNVVEHHIFQLDIGTVGGSALTDNQIHVPDFHHTSDIPSTYVPARNTIFLSIALAWAEVLGAQDIFFGSHKDDYIAYPDCRPEYFQAFEEMANLATKVSIEENKKFKIHAPLVFLSKAEIIQLATKLGVDFSLTISCYRVDKNGQACGNCLSCTIRKQGFSAAGINDSSACSTL